MSFPQNILSKYRSYSYHHVLIACDSTETANELSNSTEIVQFEHPRAASKYNPRPVNRGSGYYVVLINGMTDANFVIQSAKWETIIAPDSQTNDGQSQAAAMQLDGEIEVFEPKGVRFLNVLSHVCDSLGSDPMGLVFMLKTIFVGYTASGEQEMITGIRPLLFTPIDISAVFNETGAKYLLSLVGITNGAAKIAPVSRIAGGRSIKIEQGSTLAQAFEKLATTISDTYNSFKEATKKKFKDAGISIDLEKDFRLVEYKISLDDGFKNFKAGTNENIRIANVSGDPILHFNDNLSIDDVIAQIMESSAEVVAGKPNITYKIVSTINSTADTYTVEYQIQRYELVTMSVNEDASSVIPKSGELIEFDYIFTGKNIDIIDLDIRMEMGMSFFQTLLTAQNIPSQRDSVNGMTQDVARGSGGGASKLSPTNKPRGRTPLFLGSAVADNLKRNTRNPVDTLGFQAMLNRQAAIENIENKVTIHGNPQLLDEMQILPPEVAKGKTEKPKAGVTTNPTWTKTPTLAKINIKMPADPNDPSAGYTPFWYEGYYSLYAVNHNFSDGIFTQELQMFSLPVADDSLNLTQSEDEKNVPTSVKITDKTTNTKEEAVQYLKVGQQKVQEAKAAALGGEDAADLTAAQMKEKKQSNRTGRNKTS